MKHVLLALLFATSFLCTAQKVNISKSEIFKDAKKSFRLKYAVNDQQGGFVAVREYYGGMRSTVKGYYIQYFNSELKLVKEVEYPIKNNALRNAFIKDGQLHLIEVEHKKKQKK